MTKSMELTAGGKSRGNSGVSSKRSCALDSILFMQSVPGDKSLCYLPIRFLLGMVLFIHLSFICACVEAVEQAATKIKVEQANIGFKNIIKPGFWSPVRLKFSGLTLNVEEKISLWVHAEDDQNDVIESPIGKLTVDKGGLAVADGWFLYGHPKSKLEFSLRDGGGKTLWRESAGGLQQKLRLMRAESKLLVIVGNQEKIKAEQFASVVPESIPIFYNEEELPIDPLARDAVAAYVFIGKQGLSIAEKNSAALEQHVRGGGHILISEGINTQDWKVNALATWVPITLEREIKIKDLGAFQNYTEHSTPLWSDSPMQATTIGGYEKKMISTLEGTFAGRSSYGFGFITILGIDISEAPLKSWNSLPRLLGKALDLSTPKSAVAQTSTISRSLSHTGITDIKSHIQACLQEQFEAHGFSIYQIFGTLLLAILLVGPFDYYLCHEWLKRPYLTWFTLPLLGLTLAGFLVGMTSTSPKNELRGSQFTLLDYEAKSNTLRVHHQTGLYSEKATKSEILLGSRENVLEPLKKKVVLENSRGSWSGEQEDSFGGIRRIPTNSHDTGKYHLESTSESKSLVRLDDLPIRKWSTRELQWQGVAHLGEKVKRSEGAVEQGLIQVELSGTLNGQLVGYMVNNTSCQLKNWLISYGRRVYFPVEQEEVPTIAVQGRIKIDDDRRVRSRDLIGYITNESTAQIKRKYGVGEEIVVTQVEYDLKSRELPYIVHRLTFYDILGGANYTSLSNYEFEHLDFSSFLDMDYAVLIAEIDTKGMIPVKADQLQVSCAETTMIRAILPVGRPGSKKYGEKNLYNINTPPKTTTSSTIPGVEAKLPIPVKQQPVLPQPQNK